MLHRIVRPLLRARWGCGADCRLFGVGCPLPSVLRCSVQRCDQWCQCIAAWATARDRPYAAMVGIDSLIIVAVARVTYHPSRGSRFSDSPVLGSRHPVTCVTACPTPHMCQIGWGKHLSFYRIGSALRVCYPVAIPVSAA